MRFPRNSIPRWRRAWACSSLSSAFGMPASSCRIAATTGDAGQLAESRNAAGLVRLAGDGGVSVRGFEGGHPDRRGRHVGLAARRPGRYTGSRKPTAFGTSPRPRCNWIFAGALRLGLVEIVFVFLFVDLFDNVGTLLAVGKKAGLFEHAAAVPALNRILFSDAIATVAGSMAGTSTVVSYVESAAGVAAGGRSGVTAIVTGLLFAVALFVAPLAGAIPGAATAPALIIVGSMMMTAVADIPWTDPEIAIPAFLTMLAIPLTYSIANGSGVRFLRLDADQILPRPLPRCELDGLRADRCFLVRFYYIGAGR